MQECRSQSQTFDILISPPSPPVLRRAVCVRHRISTTDAHSSGITKKKAQLTSRLKLCHVSLFYKSCLYTSLITINSFIKCVVFRAERWTRIPFSNLLATQYLSLEMCDVLVSHCTCLECLSTHICEYPAPNINVFVIMSLQSWGQDIHFALLWERRLLFFCLKILTYFSLIDKLSRCPTDYLVIRSEKFFWWHRGPVCVCERRTHPSLSSFVQ